MRLAFRFFFYGVALVATLTAAFLLLDGMRPGAWESAACAILLSALLAPIFARGVSRPIGDLRDVARALAEHRFDAPVLTDAPDEVGELAVALRQLGGQLEALETMRRDFVANVSHELRTPITIIGGCAETLADDDVPLDTRRQFVESIRVNARRMQRIVDDLLDLSRIESGGWVPRPEYVDVRGAIAETLALVAPRASDKGVALRADVASDAATATLDRTALRQILTNLIENAVRHTPTSGHVTVSASTARDGLWIGVRDDGEGISAEHLPRIFERFYRADTGRSREDGGTGLGLAIVRHLAEAHGGKVQAESEPGRGTMIRVFFPIHVENDRRHT